MLLSLTMKTFLSALGALLLALIGVMGTTSPGDASSNIAGWAAWAGINRVPVLLRSAAADRVFQLVAAVAIALLLSSWWHRFKARRAEHMIAVDDQPSDYALSERMEGMADRLRHVRDREWWDKSDPNEDVLADLDALGITLQKAGLILPHFPTGSDVQIGLKVLVDYFTQVGALLRNGHGHEARARAARIAAPYPERSEAN